MDKRTRMRNKKINPQGFTLIELLVVVAIIALLSSIALVSLQNSRQKSRDTRRLADMATMNSALELFHADNKGYPGSGGGVPVGLTPSYASTVATAPPTADGVCIGLLNPVDATKSANMYYYEATGTSQVVNGITVYPDYNYYFCLGAKTGNFDPGLRYMKPSGVR